MTPTDFIAQYQTPVLLSSVATPLLPSVIMAQFACESAWGEAIIGNNGFGIKATGATTPYWNGDAINAATHEVKNGVTDLEDDDFRAYSSVQQSISDHNYFLRTDQKSDGTLRYAAVLAGKTPEDQANALQSCGYATAPNYASTLISIINAHGLKSLDVKKKSLS
jgi:flagellum-specific peptidoglycan hydrolase FlgJ